MADIHAFYGVLQNGSAKVVKMLLEKGANPDECTPDGQTLLALAAKVSASQGRFIFAVNGWLATLLLVSCSMQVL